MKIGGPTQRLVTTGNGKRKLIGMVKPLLGFYGRFIRR